MSQSKELREFAYNPYNRYSKVNMSDLLRRIDAFGHQIEALTNRTLYLEDVLRANNINPDQPDLDLDYDPASDDPNQLGLFDGEDDD